MKPNRNTSLIVIIKIRKKFMPENLQTLQNFLTLIFYINKNATKR